MLPSSKTSSVDGSRLLALAACIAISIAAWELPFLTPLKLLAVMGHETGHAVASKLVGGSVAEVSIASNQSGHCLSSVPVGFFSQVLVYSGGYVGAALAGAILLLLTFRFQLGRVMLGLACGWLTLMAIFYGRDLFTLGFCLGMAALFGLGAKFLPKGAVNGLNLFIATFTAMYAVLDLKDDLWTSEVRAMSDAQLLANITPVPALVWATLWTATSLVIVGVGAVWSLKRRESRSSLQTPALSKRLA